MEIGGVPVFPEAASDWARRMDALYWAITALTVLFTVLVAGLLLFFGIKYRKGSKADRSRPVHHDSRIELVMSVVPLILGLGIFVWAAKLYAEVYTPPKASREVFVIGKQWMWHLQHPNGIRENNELHVPVGETIKLTLISQDVIHSFFLPAFRIKRDVVPGKYTTVWFKPDTPGRYRLLCTEYCGTQHSLMGGWIYVMGRAEFEEWETTGGRTGTSVAGGATADTPDAQGAVLFQEQGCANCHAGTGSVARAPNLVGIYNKPQKLAGGGSAVADDAYLRESILNPKAKIVAGYQPIMPNYQGLLSEDQVIQLIAYIKSLGTDAQGKPLQQSPVAGDRASSAGPSGGGAGGAAAANTENIQADYIGAGPPDAAATQRGNPADSRNIQNDYIQNR